MASNLLFTVPGELRNQIYDYALQDDRPYAINGNGRPALALPLSRASNEIRQEILSMWAVEKEKGCMAGKRAIKARVLDLDFDPFFDFLRRSQDVSWIKTGVQRLEIHLAFTEATEFEAVHPELEAQWKDLAKYVAKTIRREFIGKEFVPQGFVASETDSNSVVLSLYRRVNPDHAYVESTQDHMLRKLCDHKYIKKVEKSLNEMRKVIGVPEKALSPEAKKRAKRAGPSGSS